MAATWANTSVRHGTQSGWRLHFTLKERPCDPCYNAKATYDRERKTKTYFVMMNRLSARAQSMAYTQMRHNHPEEYKDLYTANRQRLLIERAEELEQAKANDVLNL